MRTGDKEKLMLARMGFKKGLGDADGFRGMSEAKKTGLPSVCAMPIKLI